MIFMLSVPLTKDNKKGSLEAALFYYLVVFVLSLISLGISSRAS